MNESRLTKLIEYPWHPFLLAVFGVLSLYAYNVSEVAFTAAQRALLVSLICAGLVLGLSRLILKSQQKAALVTTLIFILFFSYGHIYNYLGELGPVGQLVRRHRYLIPFFLVCFIGVAGLIVKVKNGLQLATSTLNLILVSAMLMSLFQIFTYTYRLRQATLTASASEVEIVSLQKGVTPPDIYYLILDAYARDDVLQDFYNYDNSSFLEDLEALGFFIARCSQSNYAQTRLSLASSLNMEFISALGDHYTEDQTSRAGLAGKIKHSEVRRLFESLNYQMVTFESGFLWTQVDDVAVYLTPRTMNVNHLRMIGGLNDFELLLFKTSALRFYIDGRKVFQGFLQPALENPNLIHRDRVLFTLEQLAYLPAMPGPKFVFAHIVSPHQPFVFDLQGPRLSPPQDEFEGYRDQIAYLNSRLLPLMQKIISESSTPPVIVLQADHGGVNTTSNDRMAILNAYYLPDPGSAMVYAGITPVNTFRLIFNAYFEADLELLGDTSYHSSYLLPYRFTQVQEGRPGCQ